MSTVGPQGHFSVNGFESRAKIKDSDLAVWLPPAWFRYSSEMRVWLSFSSTLFIKQIEIYLTSRRPMCNQLFRGRCEFFGT